ncbi:MAG: dTDP-4-dehydrorhamnose 3,5-epimerase [Bacteroidales bacterium]
MTFEETNLNGAWVITLSPFIDERGSFVRMFCKDEFAKEGFTDEFVQINHSTNISKGTFRGLHYQKPPFSETKLIRCIRGKVFDIIVDIRQGSGTFLQHFTIELTPDNSKILLVPEGFAHGYITLENNSDLVYFHTSFYKPGFENALNYKDPKLNIQLPIEPKIISDKDKNHQFIHPNFEGIKI